MAFLLPFGLRYFMFFCSREMAEDPSVFTGFEMRKMAKIISPKDSLVVLQVQDMVSK